LFSTDCRVFSRRQDPTPWRGLSRSRALPTYSSMPMSADSYSWILPSASSITGTLSFTSTTSTLTLTRHDIRTTFFCRFRHRFWPCLTLNVTFNETVK